jgi:hypothetical protein
LTVAIVEENKVGMLLEEGEFPGHFSYRERLARGAVVVFPTLEKVIPDEPTTACHLTKEAFLFDIGANSEFVAALSDHIYYTVVCWLKCPAGNKNECLGVIAKPGAETLVSQRDSNSYPTEAWGASRYRFIKACPCRIFRD